MARETKAPAAAAPSYGEVVDRLRAVVEALEGGELSLEESLQRFEEGVGLVKRGEALLSEAEKRVEQLLADDRTSPVDLSVAPAAGSRAAPGKVAPPREPPEDDVPF